MSEGRKDDSTALKYDLISPLAIARLAEVLTIGAKKYDSRNWEEGLRWGRVYSAMRRHLEKWWIGEKFDKKDGQHHLSSIIWGAMVLIEYELTHPELDDRPVYSAEQRAEILKVFEPAPEIEVQNTCETALGYINPK